MILKRDFSFKSPSIKTIKANVRMMDVMISRVPTKNMQNTTTFRMTSFVNSFSWVLFRSMITNLDPRLVINIATLKKVLLEESVLIKSIYYLTEN